MVKGSGRCAARKDLDCITDRWRLGTMRPSTRRPWSHRRRSGPEDPCHLPYDLRSVTAFVTEIRDYIGHAELKEGILGLERRRRIAPCHTGKKTSGHLIGNDNGPSDGLFKGTGISHRCFHPTPVEYLSGGSTVPERRRVLGH